MNKDVLYIEKAKLIESIFQIKDIDVIKKLRSLVTKSTKLPAVMTVEEMKAEVIESAANKILKDIYDAVLPLQNFPQMAAIEPLLSDLPITFRSLIVRSIFKVIYFIDEEKEVINIATIWDCRQDDKRMKDEVLT